MTENYGLQGLLIRAGNLASATESLATLFQEEGIRLKRIDQVARLKALHNAVIRDIEKAEYDEKDAGYDYFGWKNTRGIAACAAGISGNIFNAGLLKRTSQNLDKLIAGDDPTFGTVLVCIGPGGVPDDVNVVSVSRLARESRRQESAVIKELRLGRNLLLTQVDFTGSMTRLARELMEGRLTLPFKPRLTMQIQASYQLKISHQDKG